LLSRATEGEALFLYLAVSPLVVSLVIIWEYQGFQKPVYFTSRALQVPEERYPQRPYFQEHAIKVLTEYPLKKILQKPDIFGRIVNWAMEIGEFGRMVTF
jgi:hypothetical protein